MRWMQVALFVTGLVRWNLFARAFYLFCPCMRTTNLTHPVRTQRVFSLSQRRALTTLGLQALTFIGAFLVLSPFRRF